MPDRFDDHNPSLDSPGERHYPITAGTAELDPRPRAIVCLTAGSLTIADEAAVEITYAMAAGQILPFRAVKVTAIGSGSFAGWD